jgi:predicted DNA-binding protein
MARQSMPLYLTAEQHRALHELSARTGKSMSELVREALQTYLFGVAPPTDLSDLAGAVDLGRPTDIATERDALLSEAVHAVR